MDVEIDFIDAKDIDTRQWFLIEWEQNRGMVDEMGPVPRKTRNLTFKQKI